MRISKLLFAFFVFISFVLGCILGYAMQASNEPSDPARNMTPDERYITCLNALEDLHFNSDDIHPDTLTCSQPGVYDAS